MLDHDRCDCRDAWNLRAAEIGILAVLIVVVLVLAVYVNVAHAGPLDETRYCGPPARNAKGEIIRRADVRAAFRRVHPCPSTGETSGACPGWQINHTVPLICHGCDSLVNLSWIPTVLKSGPGQMPIDRWEQKVYCADDRKIVPMPNPEKFILKVVPR